MLHSLVPSGIYRPGQLVIFRYLCRKALALRVVDGQGAGRFIEIGFGLGDWMLTLADLGFSGVGVDMSAEAVDRLKTLARLENKSLDALKGDILEIEISEKFDWVFAFEVIEHIKDDDSAIRTMAGLLKPKGRLLLSVPAHMRRWTRHDEAVGHFRRYERAELFQKLWKNGLRSELIWCYGFPFSNILGPVRSVTAPELRSLRMKEKTEISGVHRPVEERYRPLVSFITGFLLPVQLWLQDRFLLSELGDGYLVLATRL